MNPGRDQRQTATIKYMIITLINYDKSGWLVGPVRNTIGYVLDLVDEVET